MAPPVVVHTEPLLLEYRAPRCSAANFWHIFSTIAIVILSILATFASQGLWRRTNTYLEQSIVQFTERILFIFETANGEQFFWTPFGTTANGTLASNASSLLLVPIIESAHRDWNGDWRTDEIEIRIIFRASDHQNASLPTSKFISCHFALFFDVNLEQRAMVELKSVPIFDKIHSQTPFNEISVIGDFAFVAHHLLPSSGTLSVDGQFGPSQNYSGENDDKIDDAMGHFWQMAQWAMAQNYSATMERKSEHVRTVRQQQMQGAVFHFNFRARIHEQLLHYRTNGWEMLKWAWIQYLALLVIVRYVISGVLSSFLYQNQIVGTIVVERGETEGKDKMH